MTYVTRVTVAATLLLIGCTSRTSPVIDPAVPATAASEQTRVTFHVAGMNQRLQIL